MASRRGFLTGLISFVAAPAIVRSASLMPVKVMESPVDLLNKYYALGYEITRKAIDDNLYGGFNTNHVLVKAFERYSFSYAQMPTQFEECIFLRCGATYNPHQAHESSIETQIVLAP